MSFNERFNRVIDITSRLAGRHNSRVVDWRIYTRYIDGRIQVGDAYAYLSKLNADSVGAVILDPPSRFGVDSEDALGNDDSALVHDSLQALLPIAEQCHRVLRPGGVAIVLGSPRVVSAWEIAAAWSHLQLQGEMIVLWKRKRRDRRHAGSELPSLGSLVRWYAKPGRWLAPIEPLRADSNVLTAEEVPERERAHPVQQPVSLFVYLISTLTARNDLIVDPMCGTGSALVGARVAERLCIGCDVSEEMVKIARDRVGTGYIYDHFEAQHELNWWVDGKEIPIRS